MKSSYFSNKTIVCCLCNKETKGNLDRAKTILCWHCVHRLMSMSEEEKLNLFRKFEKRKDVQRIVESFMGEVTQYARRNTRTAGRPLERNRPYLATTLTNRSKNR